MSAEIASPRTVVITGATSGVGRATARAFATRGDRVGLIARGHEGLDGTLAELESLGAEAYGVSADVADPVALEEAAIEIESRLGPIEIWVNNAMVTVFSPFLSMTAAEFKRVTEVTYLGSVNGTRAALRLMAARGEGHVIQVGSALAFHGIPLQSAYCGAKHALQGFLDSVRTELEHTGYGIKVSSVHLPAVNTPQFEHGRSHMPHRARPVAPVYTPEAAADAIVAASMRPRRDTWVGAPTIATAWADRIAPGVLDRYLARTAVKGQLTDQPDSAKRRDNLFEPVPMDEGAEGPFSDEAHDARHPELVQHAPTAAVVSAVAGVVTVRSVLAGARTVSRVAHRIRHPRSAGD